jgi:hypothetical protein
LKGLFLHDVVASFLFHLSCPLMMGQEPPFPIFTTIKSFLVLHTISCPIHCSRRWKRGQQLFPFLLIPQRCHYYSLDVTLTI